MHKRMSEVATEVAILGGGCFWCLEAVFDALQGVVSVESGYMGGHIKHPSYREVCEGDTGHVEVVRVTFNAGILSYKEILEVFFAIHDPTTLNRQGNDAGTQYRSAIFYETPQQQQQAQQVIAELTKAFPSPIVTDVVPASVFYMAEDYHQEYFAHNARQPYCQLVVAPKFAKFRKQFADKIKRD